MERPGILGNPENLGNHWKLENLGILKNNWDVEWEVVIS